MTKSTKTHGPKLKVKENGPNSENVDTLPLEPPIDEGSKEKKIESENEKPAEEANIQIQDLSKKKLKAPKRRSKKKIIWPKPIDFSSNNEMSSSNDSSEENETKTVSEEMSKLQFNDVSWVDY